MVWSQEDIIFPTHAVAPPGPLPAGAERIGLDTPSGERLHGVHVPPSVPVEEGHRLLVLGFGGNAWNGQDVASYLHDLYPQAEVVVFHYRGYRPSTGRPSARALVEDAPLVHRAAVQKVGADRTVAVGFSIGSAIAASVAGGSNVDGLILVTPFDSLKAVASDIYPWLPVGAFFQHELDTVDLLRGSDVPTAIIAAERDEIIPPRRTEALRSAVPNLLYDRTVGGAGHNDLYQRRDFHQAMGEALAALRRAGRRSKP